MRASWIMAAVSGAALLALTGAAQAQDRSRDDRSEHTRFDDRDREVARDWYRNHHDDDEFRGRQQWNDEMERRLQPGVIIGRDVRGSVRSIPAELAARLGAVPRNYRYVMIGDHLCLVDKDWHLYDVIHLEHEENRSNQPADDRDRQPQMEDRNREQQFNDRDQQVMRDWYNSHRDSQEFQGREHWNDQMERRLQVGIVLDPDMRRLARPVPSDLLNRLPPAPRDFRYLIVGDHIVLVDEGWSIRQVFHFDRP